jgi:osmotically-inducible protein OsmY
MKIKLFLLPTVIAAVALSIVACNDATVNSNTNANTNVTAPRSEATPAPTATPKYTEAQAQEERARAKEKKETIGQSLDDAWVHTKLVAKLIGDTQTPERNINVDVVNGEVTLRGTVDTPEAKSEAERLAKETDGVKKVVNQLKVSPAAKPGNANKPANANKVKPN